MSDTIVDVVVVEASTLVVDVVAPPPVALVVDVNAPAPAVTVIEVADWGTVPVTYPQLPVELQQLPLSFPFAGKPVAGSVVNVPMGFALTVPPDLAGTLAYAMTRPTAPATFTLNRLSGGVVTALGTITLAPTGTVLAGSGGALAIGDVMQMAAPITQDPLLADVGITVVTERV